MEEIKPIKIIIKSNEANRDNKDKGSSPVEYDSRIFPPDKLPDEISHYALYGFFNFDNDDKTNETKNKKLQLINRHVRQRTQSSDQIENIRFLNHLETKLGIPPMGTNRLEHIYRWCKISSQIEELEIERERLR